MDIPALSIAMSQANLGSNLGVALMSESLENADETGEALIKLMEQSVNPSVGQNIDIKL